MKIFRKFSDRLQNCGKPEVMHLENIQKSDMRSTYGRNCARLSDLTSASRDFGTPDNQQWRVNIIRELMDASNGVVVVPGLEDSELKETLHFLCSN